MLSATERLGIGSLCAFLALWTKKAFWGRWTLPRSLQAATLTDVLAELLLRFRFRQRLCKVRWIHLGTNRAFKNDTRRLVEHVERCVSVA